MSNVVKLNTKLVRHLHKLAPYPRPEPTSEMRRLAEGWDGPSAATGAIQGAIGAMLTFGLTFQQIVACLRGMADRLEEDKPRGGEIQP